MPNFGNIWCVNKKMVTLKFRGFSSVWILGWRGQDGFIFGGCWEWMPRIHLCPRERIPCFPGILGDKGAVQCLGGVMSFRLHKLRAGICCPIQGKSFGVGTPDRSGRWWRAGVPWFSLGPGGHSQILPLWGRGLALLLRGVFFSWFLAQIPDSLLSSGGASAALHVQVLGMNRHPWEWVPVPIPTSNNCK